jgi:asparagine synthase (glutamine-hydrolysing)
MQGFCGFIHFDAAPPAPDVLARMRDALVRTAWSRGDAWQSDGVGLAATHWARGERPHAPTLLHLDAATGCRVVADARLDDRDALAAALGLSRDLDDAALLLHAWLRWGDHCVERLEGDFAFAIHDPRRAALFLARDRMGVRPLFWHHVAGRLCVFGSSPAAVLAHPSVPATIDEGRIADFLVTQLEGIDKTSTFHRDIQRLPPAHAIVLTADGARSRRYWSLADAATPALPQTDAAWADAVTAALERAVANHLSDHDTVGCMLSGGLDSSSLAVIASQQLMAAGRGPLPTFSSIDSGDPDCAETRAIRAMLALPGLAPTLVDHDDLEALRPHLLQDIAHAEEPIDAMVALLHAQYRMASVQGVDALMDGIDGDSLFSHGAGLVRQLRGGRWREAWRNAHAHQRIFDQPGLARWALAQAARSALVPDRLRAPVARLRLGAATRSNIRESLIAPDFARRIDLRARLATLARHGSHDRSDVRAEAIATLDRPSVTVALERYQRIGAAHGVQPRHPFTDRRLMELCIHLPDRQRFDAGWSKAVLRRALQGRLPDAVCWRMGKQHLGWALTRRLMAPELGALAGRLAGQRDLLAPYVDLSRLDRALAAVGRPGDDDAALMVFEAAALAGWLTRRT